MEANLTERVQQQNRVLIISLAAAGVVLLGLLGVVLWLALRQWPEESNYTVVNQNQGGAPGARPVGPPRAGNHLVGVWTSTIPGLTSPITTTVEFRADGTYSGSSSSVTGGWVSDSGRYTYANGILTSSGGLGVSRETITWINANQYSTRLPVPMVWTRVR
jgi:hypothetical protein